MTVSFFCYNHGCSYVRDVQATAIDFTGDSAYITTNDVTIIIDKDDILTIENS